MHSPIKKMYYSTIKNKHKKLKPGLVASYDIWRFINLSLTYLLT